MTSLNKAQNIYCQGLRYVLQLYTNYQRNGTQHRMPILPYIGQIRIFPTLLFLKMDNRQNPNG